MIIRCKSCFYQYDSEFGVCPCCGYYDGSDVEMMNQLPIGTIIANRYVIGGVLGFGGFGITYKVWDTETSDVLAIKEFFPSGFVNRNPSTNEVIVFSGKRKAEYEYGLSRFYEEAQHLTKFKTNENIVNAYGYFEENNTAYVVMEYLDGMSLNVYLKEQKLTVEESVRIVLSVCDALSAIHTEKILHRDISPDNIFLCKDGRVKLIDFGAARLSSVEDQKRTIILKPGFAPPEQYESVSTQGPWTDIYALGATMYYLVTGEKPDESTNRKIKDALLPPSELNKDIPEYISNSIMKAMALDRHLRFSSCEDFAKALRQEKKVVPVKLEARRRRVRLWISITAAVLTVTLAVSILSTVFQKEKKENTLAPASITLWFEIEDQETAKEKQSAVESIIQDFCKTYDTIDVTIKGIPKDEYMSQLQSALLSESGPVLCETTHIDVSDVECIDLSGVAQVACKQYEYYVVEDYVKKINNQKIPLGFEIPMAFMNKKKSEYTSDTISQDELLKNSNGIVITSEYQKFYSSNGFAGVSSNTDKTVFLEGDSAWMLTSSRDFLSVNSRMAGRYSIVSLNDKSLPCLACYCFSVVKRSEAQTAAAKKLIEYMLFPKYQDILHTDGKTSAFPVNKTAFTEYVGVYGQLEIIKDELNKVTVVG